MDSFGDSSDDVLYITFRTNLDPHISWTPLEEKVLAEKWLDVFKDLVCDDYQNYAMFSLKVGKF